MALISCPECGRENVSNTTTSCPGCGYNIAEHFKRLEEQQQQQKKIKQEEENKKKEIEDLMQKGVLGEETLKGIQEGRNMEKEIKRDKEIDKISTPENPEESSYNMGWSCAGYGCGTLCFIVGILGILTAFTSYSPPDMVPVVSSLILGLIVVLMTRSSNKKEKAEYQLYQELGEYEYKKRKYEEKERAKANKDPLTTLYQQQQQQASIIWCPMCHMPSGEKISATRRVVSTTALGLASSDIGKQYRCKNCGHKW